MKEKYPIVSLSTHGSQQVWLLQMEETAMKNESL